MKILLLCFCNLFVVDPESLLQLLLHLFFVVLNHKLCGNLSERKKALIHDSSVGFFDSQRLLIIWLENTWHVETPVTSEGGRLH